MNTHDSADEDMHLSAKSRDEVQIILRNYIQAGALNDFKKMCNEIQGEEKQEIINGYGSDGYTLSHWAAYHSDPCFLEHLSTTPSYNFNLPSRDSIEMKPIHWAASIGNVLNVSFLLSNITTTDIEEIMECRDKRENTPLLIAAKHGHADLCAFLLKRGANIHAVDYYLDGVLHWAAFNGYPQVVGLLCYFNVLDFMSENKLGHTPVHLASLRGHTEVLQYLLEEIWERNSSGGNSNEAINEILTAKDNEGKTPNDLAVEYHKYTCQIILKEWETRCGTKGIVIHSIQSFFRQLLSIRNWKMWMGIPQDKNEVYFYSGRTKAPMIFMIFIMVLGSSLYPWKFLSASIESRWLLLLHVSTFVCVFFWWITLFLTWETNPGTLNTNSNVQHNDVTISKHSHDKEMLSLQQLSQKLRDSYDSALESFAHKDKIHRHPKLCHSCHIVRPLRSKHCRVQRRCVLLFDHYCPFVANAVGLYNYRYFYLFLIFMFMSEVGFCIAWLHYMQNNINVDKEALVLGSLVAFFIFPSTGMVFYHTYLVMRNLTTNECENWKKYDYLQDEEGKYQNPFDSGLLRNISSRLNPGEGSYERQVSSRNKDTDTLVDSYVILQS